MALSDAKIRQIKPQPKPFKIADTNGLYLFVTPAGGKSWRMNFSLDRKQKTATFGRYPDVTLAEARIKAAEARAALAKGMDPTARQIDAAPSVPPVSTAPTFKAVADEWLAQNKSRLSEAYFARVRSRIEHDIFPFIGARHIDQIRPKDVLDVVRRIEGRGAMEIARRALKSMEDVFAYAIADDRGIDSNPASDLGKAIAPVVASEKMAAIPHRRVPAFYAAIDDYPGDVSTVNAMRFLILCWSRTGEVRHAEWREIEDLDGPEPLWRIPAERMKMREPHLVPLSRQAAAVLKLMKMITGRGPLIFPTAGKAKALSENAMLYALYAMGHRGVATVHGFRSSASTWANENGHEPDVVERCLAHVDGSVRGIYNRALYLPQRRALLQTWADYIDAPRGYASLL